jgi:hypothetical protein
VLDANGEELTSGEFKVGANKNACLGNFENLIWHKYLILKLTIGDKTYFNHYSKDLKAHDFKEYKKFLQTYKNLAKF